MSEQTSQRHALVLGASGISGWLLLNQLSRYPDNHTWQRISGTANRPFDISQSGLPQDSRIKVYSGFDFTKSVDQVAQAFREKIDDVASITHVFYTGTMTT